MNAIEIRAARALVNAFGSLMFNARAFDCERLSVDVDAMRGPAVYVRHPITNQLVGIVDVTDGAIEVTYFVPHYRLGLEAGAEAARRADERQRKEHVDRRREARERRR